ncbi:MAG TPA: response regulator [Sphingomonas sp.]|jgi:PAS domain S-box-containing protein|uniref:hybrid sensor histidine kinase/response regulator n=1 Tax=Sphingomonas sp. TaxID=28214 RepID=UPI002ED8888D
MTGIDQTKDISTDIAGDLARLFVGRSDMAARMRALDWAATPLGHPGSWPASLRASVTLMLDSGFPMFIAWGPELTFLYNDAYSAILGTKHLAALGRPFHAIWAEIWNDIAPLIDKAMAGEAVRLENLPLRMNRHGFDEETTFSFSYSPVRDDAGHIAGMFCACTETTRQVTAEAALRDLNQTLEQRVAATAADLDRVWRNARDIFVVIDGNGVFRRINPATTAILGWSEQEMIGKAVFDFVHPDDVAPSLEALQHAREDSLPTFENRYRTKSDALRTISWVAAPEQTLIYAYGRDVTAEREQQAELRAAQAALRQAQKMEAVGQLTGGLAHDFNNLLTGLMGNLELLQMRAEQGRLADADRFIIAAQGAGRRAAALTQRLLAFSRQQTLDPKPVDVNRLIAGMEDLIHRTVGPAITMEVVGAAGLWTALIDPSQLENALLNLCINARDAMPDGGRLTIETANRWVDDRSGVEHDLPPGQYLSVCVTDTGTGMSEETQARAFDPFFTTKPLGEGTGLGLSMIYGFARQSGGQVRIYSEVGQGTTMCIYLPRHAGDVDAATTEASAPVDVDGGGMTVLVVDDEQTIRRLIEELLGELGYRVIVAADGPQGLKMLQSDGRVDLLITDVGLPNGMNGRQVADAARAARPGLPVLFITGYAENAAVGNGHMEPGMELLTKPFTMSDLTRRVRSMLGS